MGIGSLGFLVCLCLGVLLFHLTPWRWLRRLLLMGVNLAFLAQFLPNMRSAIWMATILAATYAGLRLLRPRPFRGALTLFILVCVIVFTWIKQYPFVEFYSLVLALPETWLGDVQLIGLSYMLFRLIHMAVDQWQDQLEPYTLASYLNYQINCFTLVAGPIQRYNQFHAFWTDPRTRPRTTQENLLTWNRVVLGMIKMAVIAPLIQHVCEAAVRSSPSQQDFEPLRRLAAEFYGYPLYLYFNFSGYTDIAVAGACLLGLTLPENFNHPFMARNVIDFWNRWHMSLTHWVRDYVFMSSYKTVAQGLPRAARAIGYFLLFVALFVVGLWHGTTFGFAVFGTIHGLGAAANQAYADGLRRWLGPAGVKRYLNNRVIHLLAMAVTFHLVCFSFLFFALDVNGAVTLLENAWLSPWPSFWYFRAALAVVVIAALLALWAMKQQKFLLSVIDRAASASIARVNRLYVALLVQTAIVVFWLLLSLAAQLPKTLVVYQRF